MELSAVPPCKIPSIKAGFFLVHYDSFTGIFRIFQQEPTVQLPHLLPFLLSPYGRKNRG
jgi:hypothetical protein